MTVSLDRSGWQDVARGYRPLDQWLEMPHVRIARTLKHFDQATALEIFDALDLPPDDSTRQLFSQAIQRLLKMGHIEQLGAVKPFTYRLVKEMVPPALPEPWPQDGDERPGEFFWRGRWRKNEEQL